MPVLSHLILVSPDTESAFKMISEANGYYYISEKFWEIHLT